MVKKHLQKKWFQTEILFLEINLKKKINMVKSDARKGAVRWTMTDI